VDEVWLDFSFNSIVGTSRTELFARCGAAAIRVAALYHEVLNDTVKESAVIVTFVNEFDEVVSVERCLVIEYGCDVAE
jgi:hypothetical protein